MNGTASRWLTLARDKAETPLGDAIRPQSARSRVEDYDNVKSIKDQSGDLPAQFQENTALQKRKTMMQAAMDSPKRVKKGQSQLSETPEDLIDIGQTKNIEMMETQDEFTNFRFKSFRTHKLVEEDYSLL